MLGRLDFQVKLRGFRIELGEVEAVLSGHPELAEVVAVVREDQPGDQRLVAYFVTRGTEEPSSSDLRAHMKTKLPDYMVPSLFVQLDVLPLTPNAKIDRRALPSPRDLLDRTTGMYQGPRNALELQLVSIWESVLGRAPIGIRDNFFEMGGHSLLAITLLERMRKAIGREISLITIFRSPTVAELADVIAGNGFDVQPWQALEAIQPRGERPPLFFVGSTLYARALAKAIGNAQPVYGLNIFGLHPRDGSSFGFSIADVAARYIDDIRSVQPEGPYYLAGYCADAKIAFEIAQQLIAAGQKIALLAFIDEIWQAERRKLRILWQNLKEFGLQYIAYKLRQRIRYVKHKAIVTASFFNRRLREMAAMPIPIQMQHQVLIKVLYRALGSYRPQPYPGRITLFLSGESRSKYSPELARVAAGGVEVLHTPGYHINLFVSPQVDALAEGLARSIDKAANTSSTEVPSQWSNPPPEA